jgi:hypothetical protein
MDTSKEYIDMCEKATEIQDEWEYREEEIPDTFHVRSYGGYCALCESVRGRASWSQTGDYLISVLNRCHECGNKLIVRESNCYVNFPDYGSIEDWSNGGKESIWLPRQDQLQEMVANKDRRQHQWQALLDYFTMWVDTTVKPNKGWSFEQLWLAYVMEKKYNKTWQDGEWK